VRALATARPAALRKLWLYANPIGDEGVIALAEAPWVAQLEELNVTSTGMTEAGAQALLRSPHLERVPRLSCELQKPALGKPTLAALRERFGARLWNPPVGNLRVS
jgi:Leucine Rich repeat